MIKLNHKPSAIPADKEDKRRKPMGARDKLEKQYLRNNERFADAFNYFLYGGEQVIDPSKLTEIDSTEIAVPYGSADGKGKRAKTPIQRFRDQAKTWEVLRAMEDSRAIYVVLGAEAQDKVHYAAPVKDGLYDFMNYAKQVTEAAASYKKRKGAGTGDGAPHPGTGTAAEPGMDDDGRIKVSSGEFLSGFHKGDYLMPVVTLMIYFGSGEWDGPMSIHEMVEPEIRDDTRLLGAVADYRLNLLTPADIPDEDFGRFRSELGAAMYFLKKQNEGRMGEWIGEFNERFGTVDRQTADLVNTLSNSKLVIEEVEEDGGVDMCKAFERSIQEAKEEARRNDLFEFVQDGDMKIERAAERANKTVDEFIADMKSHGYSVPQGALA